MTDLTPAEQAAFEDLPLSDCPDPLEAQHLVATVRPHLYREAADVLVESLPPDGGALDAGVRAAATVLRIHANELEGRGDDH